jgi:transglutaminase-like putative cysteine protease
MEIAAESHVETRLSDPFAGLNVIEDDWSYYREGAATRIFPEYLAPTRLVPAEPAAASIAASTRSHDGRSVAAFLVTLTRVLHGLLEYDLHATTVNSTLKEVLEDKRGVCQDFTHLMLAVCRSQGIPARYVSGYVLSRPGGPAMVGGDAMHAWAECYLPDRAWHGFDPTNNLLANDQYVKIHVGRDYHDVSPTRGIYRGPAEQRLEVDVSVEAE